MARLSARKWPGRQLARLPAGKGRLWRQAELARGSQTAVFDGKGRGLPAAQTAGLRRQGLA